MSEQFRKPNPPDETPRSVDEAMSRRQFLRRAGEGATLAGLVLHAMTTDGPERITGVEPEYQPEALPQNNIETPIKFVFREGFLKKLESKDPAAVRMYEALVTYYTNQEVSLMAIAQDLLAMQEGLPVAEKQGLQEALEHVRGQVLTVSSINARLKDIRSYMVYAE